MPHDQPQRASQLGIGLRWIRTFVDRHLFTLIAIAASIVIIGFVPQVRHLFPSAGELFSLTGFGLWLYVLGTASAYAWMAFVWVIPLAEEEQSSLVAQQHSERRYSSQAASPRRTVGKLAESPVRGAQQLERQPRLLLAAAVAMIGLLWYVVPPMLVGSAATGFLEEPIRLTFFILLLAGGVWLLLKNWMSGFAWNMLGRALLCLLIANLFGELMWHLAPTWSLLSYRNYSLWAILHCVFCLLLLARVADAWQFHSQFPIRVTIVGLCLVFAASLRAAVVGEMDAGGSARAALDTWLDRVETRLDKIPDDGPVVLVAASGGGSRAALFTGIVLEALDREPIAVDVGSGATRAFRVSDHMLLISSVSGGSLASAYCVKRLEEPAPRTWRTRSQLLNSWQSDLLSYLPIEATALSANSSETVDQETLAECKELAQRQGQQLPWWLQSEFMDEMCTDFMAPLLRGALHLRSERGLSVSQFWDRRFFSPSPSGAAWVPGAAPLLLLNACEIERGERLVIGYPPVAAGMFPRNPSDLNTTRALADVNPAHQIGLAEGVRLSANFPWGFAVGEVPAPEEKLKRVHVTDGGVIDNTGIGTIGQLMERIAELEHPRAKSIVAKLRRRGLLLLEIDSGAKPSDPDWLARQFPETFEPSQGMENSSYANADRAKQHHKDILERFLRGTLPSPATGAPAASGSTQAIVDSTLARVYHVTLQCNHVGRGEGVMTAWALGPKDKASVLVRFLRAWKIAKGELATTLNSDAAQRSLRDSAVVALQENPGDPSVVQRLEEFAEQGKAVQQVLQWETLERKRRDLGLGESERPPTMQLPQRLGIEDYQSGVTKLRADAEKMVEQLKEMPAPRTLINPSATPPMP